MTVRRADWLFLLVVVLVILFVSLLPSPRETNPPVPDTAEHRGLGAGNDCLRCHAPERTHPLSPRHPKRQDCLRCHRAAGENGRAIIQGG